MADEHIAMLDGEYVLHIKEFSEERGYEVWLNSPDADYDGICLGSGDTFDAALEAAFQVFAEGVWTLCDRKATAH
jgi:hypothetical protein